MSTLPSVIVMDIMKDGSMESNYEKRFKTEAIGFWSHLRDLFNDIRVTQDLGRGESLVSIAEIHIPKVEGCTVKFEQTYSESTDYSISVKVLGLGGGANKSKKIAYGRLVETNEEIKNPECTKILIPATIKYEEYIQSSGPYKGKTLIRSETEKIDERDWRFVRLTGPLDKCGVDEAKLKDSSWKSLPPV
jgi:hypothetical protein